MEASVQFLYHDLQGSQMQRSRQTDQNNNKKIKWCETNQEKQQRQPFQHLLEPKRANEQSHTHVPRLKQPQEQKQTESVIVKDLIQQQENERSRNPSQF